MFTRHPQSYITKPHLPDYYKVIFLQQTTRYHTLKLLESKSIKICVANINIKKIILPRT